MEDKVKQFADFCIKRRVQEGVKSGHPISQSEMARRIGIPQGSLSQYENGTRLPHDDNAHKMAAYWGGEVYEILGMPRMMPKNSHLEKIADVFFRLPEDTQRKFAAKIADEAELWEEKMDGKKTNPTPVEA